MAQAMKSTPAFLLFSVTFLLASSPCPSSGQVSGNRVDPRPSVGVGLLQGEIRIDGILSEDSWATAPMVDGLTMIEPIEGGVLTAETSFRVIAALDT